MKYLYALTATALMAAPAFADGHASGDAAAGEDVFSQCQSCHVVENGDGETLAGNRGKTGPNLYNLVGRQAGTVEGFRYGDSIVAAGEAGLVWDEEQFVAYAQDPKSFLRETLDDKKARSKMTFRLRSEEDAANVWAFLAQFVEEGDS